MKGRPEVPTKQADSSNLLEEKATRQRSRLDSGI